mmetsp:Transcript_1345/g.3435  ORF Transcript_1345/g.3435 Transcript_1345/m.3435 type:complete len:85 (+) Transcript_1345:134-388(+)
MRPPAFIALIFDICPKIVVSQKIHFSKLHVSPTQLIPTVQQEDRVQSRDFPRYNYDRNLYSLLSFKLFQNAMLDGLASCCRCGS